ncbi:MAG: helix-turn-helix domain-containing protein [Coprobacillus sp.]|nr:helix-turn-helix domain-containing protein [Coprobacillus sp.]
MTKEEKLHTNVSNNLAFYRKASGYTQLEIAEKLSYTDKAVSKWERGESFPDIFVLHQLADLYGISVNDFYRDKPKKVMSKKTKRRFFTALISLVFVWLIAVVIYVILMLSYENRDPMPEIWLTFLFATIPSFILLLSFAGVWHNRLLVLVFETLLIWSLLSCVYTPLYLFIDPKIELLYLIYIVGVPLQVLVILQYFLHWSFAGAMEAVRKAFGKKKPEEVIPPMTDDDTNQENPPQD